MLSQNRRYYHTVSILNPPRNVINQFLSTIPITPCYSVLLSQPESLTSPRSRYQSFPERRPLNPSDTDTTPYSRPQNQFPHSHLSAQRSSSRAHSQRPRTSPMIWSYISIVLSYANASLELQHFSLTRCGREVTYPKNPHSHPPNNLYANAS